MLRRPRMAEAEALMSRLEACSGHVCLDRVMQEAFWVFASALLGSLILDVRADWATHSGEWQVGCARRISRSGRVFTPRRAARLSSQPSGKAVSTRPVLELITRLARRDARADRNSALGCEAEKNRPQVA